MVGTNSFSQWATSMINWLAGHENSFEPRVSALEMKQMATDQFVTDITNAINGYTAAVTAYQSAVSNEVAILNATITSLQNSLANAPSDSAAIESLVTQLNTQTASVNAAVAAIPTAPVVHSPTTPVEPTSSNTSLSN